MGTAKSLLVSTAAVADAIRLAHDDTLKLLKKLGIKPYKESRVGNRTYRHWHKSVIALAMEEADKNRKGKPAQAPLPFDEKQEAVKQVEFWQKSLGVDIDKAHTHALPTQAPVEAPTESPPKLDIAKLIEEGQSRSEEMMSVLRSIDDRLAQLVAIWSK